MVGDGKGYTVILFYVSYSYLVLLLLVVFANGNVSMIIIQEQWSV